MKTMDIFQDCQHAIHRHWTEVQNEGGCQQAARREEIEELRRELRQSHLIGEHHRTFQKFSQGQCKFYRFDDCQRNKTIFCLDVEDCEKACKTYEMQFQCVRPTSFTAAKHGGFSTTTGTSSVSGNVRQRATLSRTASISAKYAQLQSHGLKSRIGKWSAPEVTGAGEGSE